MRPTSILKSHKYFGNLYHLPVRGTTRFHLSPYELKPFKGFFSKGIPNTMRRISEELHIVVPFIIGYLIFDYGEKENARFQRKQPGQFDHET